MIENILSNFSEDTCVLMDVGEGTVGQIVRFYGDDAAHIFRKLKAVYISHLHADHHIGRIFSLCHSMKSL